MADIRGLTCMHEFIHRHPLLAFYLLAYGLTWAIGVPLMLSARGLIDVQFSHWWEPVAAFGPCIAALLVVRVRDGGSGVRKMFAGVLHWRVGTGWLLFSILSPVALLLAAIGLVLVISGPLDFDSQRFAQVASGAGLLDLVLISALLQAGGEEPGWRGFGLPQLRTRFGPLAASLALFPVWLCWHLPFFLARPAFGWFQWLGFSLGILAASIWLTYIWEGTRSIAMAVVWHAMINICRGLALAVSTALFLAIGNAVLLGAVVIAWIWWLESRRRAGTG